MEERKKNLMLAFFVAAVVILSVLVHQQIKIHEFVPATAKIY